MVFAASFVAATTINSRTQAAVLDFDDLEVFDLEWEEPVFEYGGLNWDNTWVIDGAGYGADTGYANADVSGGGHVVLNGWGEVASSSSADDFTFNGVYITSAFFDDMDVTIQSYDDGVASALVTASVNTSGPTWVAADFENVDTLVFSASGGTQVVFSDYFDEGTHFALDNFTFDEPTATPIPELDPSGASSALALLAGVGAIVTSQSRRRRRPRPTSK